MRKEMLTSIVFLSAIKLASSSSDTGKGKGCYYKGKYHKESWEDGCAYVCTCENIETGHLRCKRRCPTYRPIPDGCRLELPPGEPCCKVPVCPEQTTVAHTSTVMPGNITIKTTFTTNVKEYPIQSKVNAATELPKSNSSVDTSLSEHSLKQNNTSDLTRASVNVTSMTNNDDDFKQRTPFADEPYKNSVSDAQQSIDNTDKTDSSYSNIEPLLNSDLQLGYQKSVDELVPFDLMSTDEIFLTFPGMDETMMFENHDNMSFQDNIQYGNSISSPVEGNTQQMYDTRLNDSENVQVVIEKQATTNADPINILIFDNLALELNEHQNITIDLPSEIQPTITNDTYEKLNTSDVNLSQFIKDGVSQLGNLTSNDSNVTLSLERSSIDSSVDSSTIAAGNISTADNQSMVGKNDARLDHHGFNENGSVAGNETAAHDNDTTYISISDTGANNSEEMKGRTNGKNASTYNYTGSTPDLQKKITLNSNYVRTNTHNVGAKRGGRCVFMGMRFDTRQTWFDGCNRICICIDAKTGFFRCKERCPVFKSLPKDCAMKASEGCCPLPECQRSATPETQSVTNSNTSYRPMSIADRFNLRLVNSKPTNMAKRPILHTKLPPTALLSDRFQNTEYKARSLGPFTRKNRGRSSQYAVVHTATGTYLLNNAIGPTNIRRGSLVPVIPPRVNSKRRHAGLSSTKNNDTGTSLNSVENKTWSWQTLLGICLYNGRRYRPGDRWEIGCELVCECLPGIQGNYDCKRRCRRYPVVPFGCSLQPSSRDRCCQFLLCPSRNTQNSAQDGHVVSNDSPPYWKTLFSQKSMQTSPTATGHVNNRNPFQLGKLFRRNNSSQSTSAINISTQATLFPKGVLSKSTRKVNQIVVRTAFNNAGSTEHARGPAIGVQISQTGAVLISNQNRNKKTSLIHIATTGCFIGGKVYRKGQSWKIGCKLRCFCTDEIKQTMSCTHLCPQWKLPNVCSLEQPPKGRCCPVPKCPDSYVIKYPNGFVPL